MRPNGQWRLTLDVPFEHADGALELRKAPGRLLTATIVDTEGIPE